MTIQNTTSGALGIQETPDVNDASWLFVKPLGTCPPTATDCYSIQTMS